MSSDRLDLFTLAHKGIRWWLGTVSAVLGATAAPEREMLGV